MIVAIILFLLRVRKKRQQQSAALEGGNIGTSPNLREKVSTES